ncbi:2-amino-4-hydroxy-6-hydroxymethyldihydropteridine diphosphokinase [Methylonatrum kenyense]|uniref:2-amino-4-hydroxy-6- hydroxymethyldihydropteridine diphosphokinase n=1 Tax=Methylonatrum kenyense TaxID=455253 RepID=UPI0020C09CB1|nr:2-amino-4-hydroxy-6-hydroxymethyldihydropteridine diphosphokinase [Methylonatrum kenyense]MCK8515419.1 2-amino-4-hydroxy-6-hydroxymethyldihydropteridine diphosphokinase [Methylonatrum kenyense]
MPAVGMKAWLASGVPSPLPLSLERECGLATDSGSGYVLSLGSNDQAELRLVATLTMLARRHGALVVSRVYSTEAAGNQAGGDRFLNLAVYLRSPMSARQLKAELQRIESRLGRRRAADDTPLPVSIDLDILAGPLDRAAALGETDWRSLPAYIQRPMHEIVTALNVATPMTPERPGPLRELDIGGWRIGHTPLLLQLRGENRITTAGPVAH